MTTRSDSEARIKPKIGVYASVVSKFFLIFICLNVLIWYATWYSAIINLIF